MIGKTRLWLYPLLVILAIGVPLAIAQENATDGAEEIAIEFSASQVVVIAVGALGGLTTAYLGSRKRKSADPKYVFDIHKFMDRVIIAVIVSVGLAIAAMVDIVVLNPVTIFMIFTSSIGTAELGLQVWQRNKGKPVT